MRTVKLAIAVSMFGALLAGRAAAQVPVRLDELHQPASVQRTAFEGENYLSFAQPNGGASESPSNQPTATPQKTTEPAPAATTAQPAAQTQTEGYYGGQSSNDGDERWTLPQLRFLQERGVTVGGWTEVGGTFNNWDPVPDYNGTVGFMDRSGQLHLNQQWFFLDKPINNDGSGWAWGGRVDLAYGSDAFFTEAYGLENPGHQTDYYQAALPQMYVDVAYNDLTIRMGHFFTMLGYEVVQAPQNFFYTHSYTHMYGEPFTHTGMLFMYKVNDQFSFSAGMHRGDDQWEARPGVDHLGFLGGIKWTGPNKKLELAWSVSTSEMIVPEAYQQVSSFVATYHFSERFRYVFQSDYGQVANSYVANGGRANWYGVNQYFLYELNKCWAFGARLEWFRDEEGVRVSGAQGFGMRPENPIFGNSFPGDFYEASVGLNWKPTANFTLRPEIRYDSYTATGNPPVLPFDNGLRSHQWLFGMDAILTY